MYVLQVCLIKLVFISVSDPLDNSAAATQQNVGQKFDIFEGWEQIETHEDELSNYIAMGKPDESATTVLEWWKVRQSAYPRLSKVAKKVFCVPATSAGSERVFSRAGFVLSDKRSNTSPDNVQDLLFYGINKAVSDHFTFFH